jgi:D-3-phosphoglycerate dehydrogenase
MRVKVTTASFSRTGELRAAVAAAFPDVVFRPDAHGALEGEGLMAFLSDADAAIVGLDPITESTLDALPRLRAICKYGVGLDNIDLAACRRRGIFVGWTPGVNRRSVAELTLGAMLGLARNIVPSARALSAGQWKKDGGFQLSGRTVGILGLGHIGSDVATLLDAFGCRILVHDCLDKRDICAAKGWQVVSFEQLLAGSELLTIHTPLTPQTDRLFNTQTLAAMRPGAILINTARGPIVDQSALKAALMNGILGGAALDVYDPEPPTDLEFLALPNLLPTPHIGGNAHEGIVAMGMSAIGHLKAFAQGAPQPPLPTA